MIGSIIRWLRFTLPAPVLIIAFVFCLLVIEGLYYWSLWFLNVPEISEELSAQLLKMRDGFAAGMMALYAIFRVAAFHPVFRPKYHAWIEQTPWCSRKPLPLGPIHLTWQDILLLGVVILALHGSSMGHIWVLEAFLFAYLGILGYSFFQTGPWWASYLVLFGIGLAIRVALDPFLCLSVLAIVFVVAMIECSLALKRFPWTQSGTTDDFNWVFMINTVSRQKSVSVWPFSQMLDVPPGNKVDYRHGFLAPLLAAWIISALASNLTSQEDRLGFSSFPFFAISFIAIITRLLAYIIPSPPPISLAGRLVTRRWIIPGYDRVFLAPLCALLTSLLGWMLAKIAGPAYCTITYPLATASVLIIALNMGPSIRRWKLTGHHQIALGNPDVQNHVKL